ncbi:MAG: TIR domain-containing protein [Halieaceae bacterium]|nr:TIR domain-containing protein [Halieaceae bacterium]
MQYRAFISHSHDDAKFAAWLQRALEHWRVPRRLQQRVGHSRIKPIFRDRTDLRAATSLGEQIETVLTQSDNMIVVCSEAAARSEWVEREILRYRELNPAGQILPLIVSGEPPYCFPRPLIEDADGNALEPLAADARKAGDGRRDAVLKLLAGLIDVDFDELKQRDFQRRQQRLTAVAALSAGVAAVTLYLAYLAYEARDDANRRREQADDLIAFMLGDLRGNLEPIGKLDILDAVGDKALDYFSELEGEDITPEVVLKHAMAMRQIGEVQMARGDLSAASVAFERSLAALGSIRDTHPEPISVVYEIAQNEFWLGNVAYEQNDAEQRTTRLENYLAGAKTLVALDPNSVISQQELGYAYQNLGIIALQEGKFGAAEGHLLQSLKVQQGLNDRLARAQRLEEQQKLYSWLGHAAYRQGKLSDTLVHYQNEFTVLDELVRMSDDMWFREKLSSSGRRLATFKRYAGDYQGAVSDSARAYAQAKTLHKYDPENFYWMRECLGSALEHSRSLLYAGDRSAALAVMESLEQLPREVRDAQGGRADGLKPYLDAVSQRALSQWALGDLPSARAGLAEALAFARDQPEASFADNADAFARLYLLTAEIAEHFSEGVQARALRQRAHTVLRLTEQASLDPSTRILTALVLDKLQLEGATLAFEDVRSLGVAVDSSEALAQLAGVRVPAQP